MFARGMRTPLLLPSDTPEESVAHADAVADSLCAAPHKGDFCWSPCRAPDFYAALCRAGFLPITSPVGGWTDPLASHGVGGKGSLLLPKLHQMRCVILLPHDLRPARSTRKRAARFELSIDTCLDAVVDGCIAQHGLNWLGYVRDTFEHLHATPRCGVSAHSIEVWDKEGMLVAGEIGVVAGAVYTR